MKNKAKKSIQYKRKLINAVNKQTILQMVKMNEQLSTRLRFLVNMLR